MTPALAEAERDIAQTAVVRLAHKIAELELRIMGGEAQARTAGNRIAVHREAGEHTGLETLRAPVKQPSELPPPNPSHEHGD